MRVYTKGMHETKSKALEIEAPLGTGYFFCFPFLALFGLSHLSHSDFASLCTFFFFLKTIFLL